MKLSFLILWVSFLSSEVHALYTSAPYQHLYFYYAYKIEFSAFPASGRTIATGCKHQVTTGTAGAAVEAAMAAQGVKGICTFGEFVRHVLSANSKKLYSKTAGVTIDPDSSVVRDFPNNRDVKLRNNLKLLPTYDLKGKTQIPLQDIISTLTDQIQSSRTKVAANTDLSSKVAALVAKASGYIRISSQWRAEDNTKFRMTSFEENNKKWLNFEVRADREILDLDGELIFRYEDLDIDGTIHKAGSQLEDADRESFRSWSEGYGTEDGKTEDHMNIIASMNQAETRINGNPGC